MAPIEPVLELTQGTVSGGTVPGAHDATAERIAASSESLPSGATLEPLAPVVSERPVPKRSRSKPPAQPPIDRARTVNAAMAAPLYRFRGEAVPCARRATRPAPRPTREPRAGRQ